MSTPLRVGIAGLGRSGWGIHASYLRTAPELFRIEAVADLIPERVAQAAAELRCRAYPDAESLIADLVTGVFMLFENQYNVGDYIEVAGFRGRVTEIGIRTTCIEDPGGNVKIVNNSAMTNLLNRSDKNSRAVSSIGIPYATDLEALEKKFPEMMARIHERHEDIMLADPIYLGVDELGNSSVVLKFVVEVDDKNIYAAARQLNRELFLEFRKAGVEVPFPQVDVHQKD